jgi:hypothetical protein
MRERNSEPTAASGSGPHEPVKDRAMRRPKILGARFLGIAALPVALLATAGIVTASSYSVFSATTNSPTNGFAAGSVVLTNDSTTSGTQSTTGSALYTVTGITPTSAAQVRCVVVQSTGTSASAVKLYTANPANVPAANTLAQYLKVQVEIGTVGSTCASFTSSSTISPTGTLAAFEAATTYANGKDTTWAPTGTATESRAFRFTVTPDSTMPNTVQGARTSIDFVWEADNT